MKQYLLVLLIISLVGCQNKEQKNNFEKITLNSLINSDSTSHTKLNKRVLFEKQLAIEKADLILNDSIYVWDYWEPVYSGEKVDWDMNPYNNDSWRLYLQSLRMVGILSRAYEYEKNQQYIDKAFKLIYSWNDYQIKIKSSIDSDDDEKKKKYQNDFWTDHMVANRSLNLTHLFLVTKEVLNQEQKTTLLSILKEQAKWLYDDNNYTRGNHAIMQDRALMQTALVFNFEESQKWYEKSLERVLKTFDDEITIEGVCVENSPGYHPYVMDLLDNFIQMGNDFNKPLPQKYQDVYEKMKKYLVYIIKPNNEFPALGDTYLSEYKLNLSKKYEDQELLYVDNQGLQGEQPSQLDIVYVKSGYAVLREGWSKGIDFKKQTQITFINTNQSKVHKHSDYLSFVLYSNEENLIVDPGHIGYQKDSITTYLKSTTAHNTLTVDMTDFDFREVPLDSSASIDTYKIDENYSMVKGYFKPNDSLSFTRNILYLKPNAVLLVDEVNFSYNRDVPKKFHQIFNLGEDTKILSRFSKNHLEATFNKNSLHFFQKVSINDVLINKGETSLRAIVADGPSKYRKGNQIIFEKNIDLNKSKFITLLYIENDNENNIKKEDISITQEKNSIDIKWKSPLKEFQVKL